MRNSKPDYFNPSFSHIYIEKSVAPHPQTAQILAHFSSADIIGIDNYKNLYSRRGQNHAVQHKSQALILAKKEPPYFYEGAEVCQSFGNANFYYTSLMRGCIYDCSYCYLKGMYESGHLVIFVNLEDYFSSLEELLEEKNVYLCISYDTDLLALEAAAGYVGKWAEFAREHAGLTLEVRTKCARPGLWEHLPSAPNVIYAFSVSPQRLIDQNERGTPSARARIASALAGLEQGKRVRLCFDPMLYLPEWRQEYRELLQEIDMAFAGCGRSMRDLEDVSVGCFRISQEYMKKLRDAEPFSAAVQFPYVNVGGVYQYPQALRDEMEGELTAELEKRMDREKIYHE